jgi:hypothetical protein
VAVLAGRQPLRVRLQAQPARRCPGRLICDLRHIGPDFGPPSVNS